MPSGSNQHIEISLSYRFAQEHNWVIHGLTGFFSAYYMEKPGFRVLRHYEELETGMHVWLCEIPPGMRIQALLKRLQYDLPPFRTRVRQQEGDDTIARHVIDCIDDNP